MTKDQLSAAMTIAKAEGSLLNEDLAIFEGYGLPSFKAITCTVRQVAALIRWQCVNIDGGIDGLALQELASRGKTLFNVL